MTNSKIWLSAPHMGGEEIKYVQEAFDTNWISPVGPHITAFENELSGYLNVPHCAALSSGTSAIHLALILLGVEQGDEVLCSTFTFAGTCNPIIYQRAKPIFIDSESVTWNIDPELMEEAIQDRIKKTGKKPKAVIAVHLYGMPAQIDRITKICAQYDIPLIEDAAESLGSRYHGKMLGSYGDISILSFNGNKIITTSGGGALLSKRKDWVEKARFLSTQARDSAPHYEHSQIGYNYRMSNICAGIGRGQLKVIEERVKKRREIFKLYEESLGNIDGLSFQQEPDGCFSNRWLSHVLLNNQLIKNVTRETLRLALEEKNIESRPLWKPMHLQPVFRGCVAFTNGVSEQLFNQGICLPSGTGMSMDQQYFVIHEVKKHLNV